jgi:hypothetical protein
MPVFLTQIVAILLSTAVLLIPHAESPERVSVVLFTPA